MADVKHFCEICGKHQEVIYQKCKLICSGCGKIILNCNGDIFRIFTETLEW